MATAIAAVEALAGATVSNVDPGSLVTRLPKGPDASEMKDITNGYNDTYATFYLTADENQVAFTFTPAEGRAVPHPIIVVQDYTADRSPEIKVAGAELGVNTGDGSSGAYVSLNAAADELWVTLNITLSAPTVIEITPSDG